MAEPPDPGEPLRIHGKDYLDNIAKVKLAKAAYELGFEVGEHGHEDSLGWVDAELKHIIQQAEELGVMDLVRRRYEFGKEKGRTRKQEKTVDVSPNQLMRARRPGLLSNVGEIPEGERRGMFAPRVSPEESIWSTISIMRFARGDEQLQSHLGNMFAGVGDLHDRIMDMQPGGTPEMTFDSALSMIAEVGWLSTYEIKFFDERSSMASIDATSMLARSFGKCATPMCLPIVSMLETAGLRAFGRPTLAVEEACMAQGRDHCTFKLFPREVSKG